MSQDKLSEKLRKKLLQEQQKRMKPGECEKYIRIVFDEDIVTTSLGRSVIKNLADAQIKYVVRNLPSKQTIIWQRNVGQQTIISEGSENMVSISDKFETESQVIRLFMGNEFLEAVKNKTIDSTLEKIKLDYSTSSLTLIIAGLPPTGSTSGIIEREATLAELQIAHECNIQSIASSAGDLIAIINRFTKAIAQIPLQKQKSKISASSNHFLLNDNKDCVRVEGGHGLTRLWQQHLNRLPLVTLDVAEAILSKYSCPKALIEAFESNGANFLANIKISRGPAVLSNERRIGEVLSKKLYTLYHSIDPNEVL